MRKACGRAREVSIVAYGGRAVDLWWAGARETLERQERLAVREVPLDASRALSRLAGRSMRLQFTIQDGHVYVTDGAVDGCRRSACPQGHVGCTLSTAMARPSVMA